MRILKSLGAIALKWWMSFARGVAFVNTTIILTLVYIVVVGPSWLIATVLRKDLLDKEMGERESFWKNKKPINHTIEQHRHQF